MRYHQGPIRMAKIKTGQKQQNLTMPSADKDVKQLELSRYGATRIIILC